MTTDDTKICTKCKCEFPATPEYFHRDKRVSSGLRADCKACERKRNDEWVAANPVTRKEINARWRSKNRTALMERSRLWREANPTYNQEYKHNHLEDGRIYSAKRRAWKRTNGNGEFTLEELQLLFKNQRGKCWWCGKKFKLGKYEIDHRIPLSRNGKHHLSNIVLACVHCNRSKKDKMPWEWIGRLL